jgi:small subunit ribosomal protein S17e
MEVLENNKSDFGINFDENKKTLDGISIIRSKCLKNEIAGYITRFLKHEMLDKKKQDERLAKQTKLDEETSENSDSNASEVKTSTPSDVPQTEEKTQEIPENASE